MHRRATLHALRVLHRRCDHLRRMEAVRVRHHLRRQYRVHRAQAVQAILHRAVRLLAQAVQVHRAAVAHRAVIVEAVVRA